MMAGFPTRTAQPPQGSRKHSHYHKACPYPSIDVYRVLELFKVTDPCIQHAVKKLLVAGGGVARRTSPRTSRSRSTR